MTEKQFIIQFLGITEQDYDTLLINPKLMCEMLEAYQKEINPEKYFGRNSVLTEKEMNVISQNA